MGYRVYPFTVDAGQSVEHVTAGSAYGFLDATAELHVGEGNAAPEPLPATVFIDADEPFQKLRVVNENAFAVDYRLAVNTGGINDNRFGFSGGLPVKAGGATFSDWELSVGTSPVLILAANSGRSGAVIRAGASDLYLGPDVGVVARSVPTIPAGGSMSVGHTGSVYGVRANGPELCGVYEETE